jgi:hypothetical protein
MKLKLVFPPREPEPITPREEAAACLRGRGFQFEYPEVYLTFPEESIEADTLGVLITALQLEQKRRAEEATVSIHRFVKLPAFSVHLRVDRIEQHQK